MKRILIGIAIVLGIIGCARESGLLVSTGEGLLAIDLDGNVAIITTVRGPVEVYNDRVFVLDSWTRINEFDKQGTLLNIVCASPEIPGCHDFAVLPNLSFALLDNTNDRIYFIDSQGSHLQTVDILKESDDRWQNLDGIVVDNSLIVSEDGHRHIVKVDLTSYNVDILKDLTGLSGWLGAIDHYSGVYYICQAKKIYCFVEGQEARLISTLSEGNITGIVVGGDFAFVTINSSGNIYKVNIPTGKAEILSEGLDYPKDIEWQEQSKLPLRLQYPFLEPWVDLATEFHRMSIGKFSGIP